MATVTVEQQSDAQATERPQLTCPCGQQHATVWVEPRTWPGINKHGGWGRLINYRQNDEWVHVKYLLGGQEKHLDSIFVHCTDKSLDKNFDPSKRSRTTHRAEPPATVSVCKRPPVEPRTLLATVKPSAINQMAPVAEAPKPEAVVAKPSLSQQDIGPHAKPSAQVVVNNKKRPEGGASNQPVRVVKMKKSPLPTTATNSILPREKRVDDAKAIRPFEARKLEQPQAKAPPPVMPTKTAAFAPQPQAKPVLVPPEKPRPAPAKVVDYQDSEDTDYLAFLDKLSRLGAEDLDGYLPIDKVMSIFKADFSESQLKRYLSQTERDGKIFMAEGQLHFVYL